MKHCHLLNMQSMSRLRQGWKERREQIEGKVRRKVRKKVSNEGKKETFLNGESKEAGGKSPKESGEQKEEK